MQLYLIRHGETDWNNERRIQGHSDTPLNPRGIEQANCLAERLAREAPLDALYTSSLARARDTAEAIGRKLGLAPILDERLREQFFGEVEGLTRDELHGRFPHVLKHWNESKFHIELPGAETIAQFHRRVESFVEDIKAKHNGARVAVVSHGGTINLLLASVIGLDVNRRFPFWLDNASLSLVEFVDVRARIRLLNDTCHLEPNAPKYAK